jgi:hypothetical protein
MVTHFLIERKQSIILCRAITVYACGKICNQQDHWKYTDQEENVTCKTCLRILKRRNNESKNSSIGCHPIEN